MKLFIEAIHDGGLRKKYEFELCKEDHTYNAYYYYVHFFTKEQATKIYEDIMLDSLVNVCSIPEAVKVGIEYNLNTQTTNFEENDIYNAIGRCTEYGIIYSRENANENNCRSNT